MHLCVHLQWLVRSKVRQTCPNWRCADSCLCLLLKIWKILQILSQISWVTLCWLCRCKPTARPQWHKLGDCHFSPFDTRTWMGGKGGHSAIMCQCVSWGTNRGKSPVRVQNLALVVPNGKHWNMQQSWWVHFFGRLATYLNPAIKMQTQPCVLTFLCNLFKSASNKAVVRRIGGLHAVEARHAGCFLSLFFVSRQCLSQEFEPVCWNVVYWIHKPWWPAYLKHTSWVICLLSEAHASDFWKQPNALV